MFICLYVCTVNTHYSLFILQSCIFQTLIIKYLCFSAFQAVLFFIAIFLLINIWVLLLIFFNKSKKVLSLGKIFFFVSNKDKEWRKSSDFILKKFIKRCKVAAHKSQIGDFFCWISVCDRLKPSLYAQKLKRRIIAASRLFNIAPVSWIISAWKNFKLEIIAKNDWNYKQ